MAQAQLATLAPGGAARLIFSKNGNSPCAPSGAARGARCAAGAGGGTGRVGRLKARKSTRTAAQSPGHSPAPPPARARARPRPLMRSRRANKTEVLAKEAAASEVTTADVDAPASGDAAAPEVQLIVTDVDGTLLNSDQELTTRTELAIARAASCGVPVVLATGKSRGPWAEKLIPKLPVSTPGVFIQGLLTCDADGNVIESIELDPIIAQSVIRFAERRGRTLVAFCGRRILCAERDADADQVLAYGEPEPEAVGPMVAGVVDAEIPINKLLMFVPEEDMASTREDAELMFEGDCTITTAVPGMLEFLPLGASKGAAVAKLLKRMGVDPANVLALGDGENDVEMLELAGTSVAMAGSSEKVAAAARGNVGLSNDEGGVADAIERYVLNPRGLESASDVKVSEDEDEAAPAVESKTVIKNRAIAAAVEAAEEAAAAKREAAAAKKEAAAAEAAAASVAEAKRKNAELLEASKAAAERLAELRGSLQEAEAELVEAEEARERRNGSVREKAKKVAEAKKAEFDAAKEADKRAAEAEARQVSGGWGEDQEAADSWAIAAESEQRSAAAAAAAAAAEAAKVAAAEAEAAVAADAAAAVDAEIVEDTPASASASASSSVSSAASAGMPSWANIGSFFTAALETVSRLASPESRAKQAAAERAAAKASLLATVVSTNIGRDCDADQLRAVLEATLNLEALNPTNAPGRSTLTRGRWSAVFTNSRQLLGLDKKLSLTRQSGPVYVALDVDEGRSEVQYTWPVKVERAGLEVSSDGYRMALAFEQTKIFGLFGMPGGSKPREYGDLEITYLDLDLMVCRGANSTVYVFVQTNSNYRIGDTTSGNVNRQLGA